MPEDRGSGSRSPEVPGRDFELVEEEKNEVAKKLGWEVDATPDLCMTLDGAQYWGDRVLCGSLGAGLGYQGPPDWQARRLCLWLSAELQVRPKGP